MDSLGDYIYLIIIALAGLSSFLKKKKKETESTDLPENERPDYGDIPGFPKAEKDWWEEESDYQPEPAAQPVKPVYAELKPIKQSTDRVALETMESYEYSKDIQKLRIKKTVHESGLKNNSGSMMLDIENEENTFLSSIRLDDVDDAKRAFIYTEIFNRKY